MTNMWNMVLKSTKGMVLVEQLIALSLALIILCIGYSLYVMGIKGFIYDANGLDNQSNVRIAMDHISRTFRQYNSVKVEGGYLKVGPDIYRLEKDVLMINRNQLAVGISEFLIYQPLPHQVYIRISSLPNGHGESYSLESWLTVRRF